MIAYEMVIPSHKADVFSDLNMEKFHEAVEHLANDLLQDNINVPKVHYLFLCMWNCVEAQKDKIPV